MAAGVPVISTNAGGLPEINIDGQTGYLGDVGDTDTMSQKAISLLLDENKLNQFKANAELHAKSFDIEIVIPEYEQLYNRFLK